jgi:adenosylcobinamide-GDP ribazoletransferase
VSARPLAHRVRRECSAALAALGFLTRIPVPPTTACDPEALRGASLYFPLVGALIGAVAGAVYAAARAFWSPPVAIALMLATAPLLTGGLHEDALADAADGFGGGRDRPHTLAIMADSRIGALGALAIALSILAKLTTLTAIAGGGGRSGRVIAASVVAHAVARWSCLPLVRRYPDPRQPGGSATLFARGITPRRLLVATALVLTIAALLLGRRGLVGVALAALASEASGRYYRARVGGITGDCLGATIQLVELLVYLIAAGGIGARGSVGDAIFGAGGEVWRHPAHAPHLAGSLGERGVAAIVAAAGSRER